MRLLVICTCIAAAFAMEGFQHLNNINDVIDGEYLIRINEGLVARHEEGDVIHMFQDQYSVYVIRTYHVGKITLFHVKGEKADLLRVEALSIVRYVDENKIYTIATCTNRPSPGTWGLDRIDQRERLPYDDPAYNHATYTYDPEGVNTGKGVVAYVCDTGIDWENADFNGRARFGYSCYSWETDGGGHGTHCAGTVGSSSYGVAKDVELVAVKVLNDYGGGTADTIIEGLEWILADHNKRSTDETVAKSVVNMSLGGAPSDPYEDALNELLDAGIVIVAAASNYDDDACKYMPALVPRVITVGAVDVTDTSASFTNYGTCVDISAPGVDILSLYKWGDTATISGTSMACPHVVGVVARYQSSLDYTPTIEQVDEWIKAQSTVDAITWYRDIHGTSPNRLLYGEC